MTPFLVHQTCRNGMEQRTTVACVDQLQETYTTSCVTARLPWHRVATWPGAKKKLSEHTENARIQANEKPRSQLKLCVQLVPAGQSVKSRPQDRTPVLAPGSEWSMRADLDKQLRFLTDISNTTLRPDMVLWCGLSLQLQCWISFRNIKNINP